MGEIGFLFLLLIFMYVGVEIYIYCVHVSPHSEDKRLELTLFSVQCSDYPRTEPGFGSFSIKAGVSLTACLRWAEVCFQSPCFTE